jgi:hypothetical protein
LAFKVGVKLQCCTRIDYIIKMLRSHVVCENVVQRQWVSLVA